MQIEEEKNYSSVTLKIQIMPVSSVGTGDTVYTVDVVGMVDVLTATENIEIVLVNKRLTEDVPDKPDCFTFLWLVIVLHLLLSSKF